MESFTLASSRHTYDNKVNGGPGALKRVYIAIIAERDDEPLFRQRQVSSDTLGTSLNRCGNLKMLQARLKLAGQTSINGDRQLGKLFGSLILKLQNLPCSR
jgi:hypothetical protein